MHTRTIATQTHGRYLVKGNPGAPFYFLFIERDGSYQLSGEGTGLPAFTRRAYDDLRRLSDQEIQALLRETQKGPRAAP